MGLQSIGYLLGLKLIPLLIGHLTLRNGVSLIKVLVMNVLLSFPQSGSPLFRVLLCNFHSFFDLKFDGLITLEVKSSAIIVNSGLKVAHGMQSLPKSLVPPKPISLQLSAFLGIFESFGVFFELVVAS